MAEHASPKTMDVFIGFRHLAVERGWHEKLERVGLAGGPEDQGSL